MSRSTAVALLIGRLAFLARANGEDIETPKVELDGSYDYVRYNANPRINGASTSESYGANGITGQAAYNLDSRFGIVGEISVYSLARTDYDTTHEISFLFGPRVSLRRRVVTPYVQVLVGGVWAEDGVTLGPVTAFGTAAGGGIELQVSRYFALRPIQVEYFMTRFPDGAHDRQNNFRLSAGITLRRGKK
jgi:hypothetical protein